VVVGAGHNGLVCSFYLARAGLRVGVFERRDLVGGAAVTEPLLDGARFSTCANMLWGLQQRVVDDMGLVGHGFRYRHVDPVALHLYRDGSFLRTWRDPRRTAEEIARLNPGDRRAFAAWDAYWARAARLMSSFVLAGPPSREDVLERAGADGLESFAVDMLGSSLADVVHRHFEDRRVQAAFVAANDFGDPSAPGSAWTQAFGHIGRTGEVGDAFVDGGLGALTAAMARAAAAEGSTSTPGPRWT
jgi:phytoene dehydrogenase-like protein